jgi:hypothetical protein
MAEIHTLDEALAYLRPHPSTKGPVILTPEKMREAISVIEDAIGDAKGAAALNLAQLKQWRARAEKAEGLLQAEAEREFAPLGDWGRV